MHSDWFFLKENTIFGDLYASLSLYVLTVILVCALLRYVFTEDKRTQQLQDIPGPNAICILRIILEMVTKGITNSAFLSMILTGMARIFDKEGIFRAWVLYFPVVFIYKAETIERLLSNEDGLNRAPEYQFVSPAFRTGILTCPAKEWRKRRKLLTPAFNSRILEDCMPIFNKQAKVFIENVKSFSDEMPVNVIPLTQHCSFDIICEAAMGVDIQSQLGKNTEFVHAAHGLLQIVQQRIVQFWLHSDFVFKYSPVGRRFRRKLKVMDDFTRKVILSRKEAMLSDSQLMEQIRDGDKFSGCRKKLAFLDLLLYHHLFESKLTETDVLGEVTTFMVAGYDTSGLTLAWALFLVGHDPRVQDNIHRELDEVFAGDKERPVTQADTKELPYLKCVIQETLRLYPPGSYFGRYTVKDIVINDYTIPSGTRCIGVLYQLHRDPRYFPSPERFIPERFLSSGSDKHPYSYIPFNAGPKSCIGQKFAMYELLSVLADIFRNFSVKSVVPREKIGLSLQFVLVPTDPLLVSFTPR